MRALATRREAADHDRGAIARGVPGVVLMENAARGAADVIVARWSPAEWSRPLVLGGTGLNGGDGWAVARQLLTRGAQPRAILVGDPSRVLGDARINLEALRALGVPVEVLGKDDSLLEAWLSSSSLLVDAVFGTGLDRDVGGAAQQVIERANVSGKPIVALDLPSGICADTGRVLGVAIRATRTVTFGAAKRGLHQHPGVAHAGEVIVVDIGVPSGITSASLLGREDLALGRRAEDTHKGSAGRVLVLAGSPGKTGAALLAGLGALRCGAGLVTLGARGAARAALDAKVVELMTTEIPEALEAGVSAALREGSSRDAAVLGPGVGLDPTARAFLERTAMELTVPTVLDADALTAFAGSISKLKDARGPRILTPHPGEAAALLGVSTEVIQADRYGAATALADGANATVVLKGARTVIAVPGGRLFVCVEGTPALATGGTGDVLSGVLAACLVHLSPAEAACQGVLLHALAGMHAARADRGLLAHEVADALPSVMSR